MLSLLLQLLNGCSSLLFYPDHKLYVNPVLVNPEYESHFITSSQDNNIHAWWMPAITQPVKGTVWFFHGNAQNISSHVVNLSWINHQGYNLFIFDYQGYGKSQGSPSLENAQADARAVFRWLIRQSENSNSLPLFVVGQSLGAAIALEALAREQTIRDQIQGIVIDSTFTGYQTIAREKLAEVWLTWPLQYPLSWLIQGGIDPLESQQFTGGIPKLYLHSKTDKVIPYSHGLQLFQEAPPPKKHLSTRTRHAGSFDDPEFKEALIEFLDRNLAGSGETQ